MFGHRSFLVLGGGSPADIVSLIKGGYEISIVGFPLNKEPTRKEKQQQEYILELCV
jgi:hypothetical protein